MDFLFSNLTILLPRSLSLEFVRFESAGGSGSFIRYPFMSKNFVERFVKQRELVFRCSNVHIYRFFYKIWLRLNSYVHGSAVSAPKNEDEVLSTELIIAWS